MKKGVRGVPKLFERITLWGTIGLLTAIAILLLWVSTGMITGTTHSLITIFKVGISDINLLTSLILMHFYGWGMLFVSMYFLLNPYTYALSRALARLTLLDDPVATWLLWQIRKSQEEEEKLWKEVEIKLKGR